MSWCFSQQATESLKCFTQRFIWKLMEWGDSCLAFSYLRHKKIFLQKFLYNLLPSLQAISLKQIQPPLGFSSQGKWKQTEPHCIFWHTGNLYCVANLNISSQVCVRVFIWQSMKQISLNQLNQGMRISDVVSLNFRPRNDCEELWHGWARIIFKSNPPWLIFSHNWNLRCTYFRFS